MAATEELRPPAQRSRLRLGIVIALVCGAIAFLLVQGLGNATTYFRNADEALADREDLGTSRFRLQGTVVDVARSEGGTTVFDVEYDCARVAVAGPRPAHDPHGVGPEAADGGGVAGQDVTHGARTSTASARRSAMATSRATSSSSASSRAVRRRVSTNQV